MTARRGRRSWWRRSRTSTRRGGSTSPCGCSNALSRVPARRPRRLADYMGCCADRRQGHVTCATHNGRPTGLDTAEAKAPRIANHEPLLRPPREGKPRAALLLVVPSERGSTRLRNARSSPKRASPGWSPRRSGKRRRRFGVPGRGAAVPLEEASVQERACMRSRPSAGLPLESAVASGIADHRQVASGSNGHASDDRYVRLRARCDRRARPCARPRRVRTRRACGGCFACASRPFSD